MTQIIVRMEFSPLVEIGVNAGACAFLRLIINRWHDSKRLTYSTIYVKIVLSFRTNMHQGSGIDQELITILAFLVKDSPKKL